MNTLSSSLKVLTLLAVSLAAGAAYAQESLSVDVKRQKVTQAEDGRAVDVAVGVTCGQGSTILEALLYVVQDGNTSQFSSIPVVCDGMRHEYVVTVVAFPETPFHRGKAISSAYVLLNDSEGTSAGDTERIKIRKPRSSSPH